VLHLNAVYHRNLESVVLNTVMCPRNLRERATTECIFSQEFIECSVKYVNMAKEFKERATTECR
jgi:hypothetical protein